MVATAPFALKRSIRKALYATHILKARSLSLIQRGIAAQNMSFRGKNGQAKLCNGIIFSHCFFSLFAADYFLHKANMRHKRRNLNEILQKN